MYLNANNLPSQGSSLRFPCVRPSALLFASGILLRSSGPTGSSCHAPATYGLELVADGILHLMAVSKCPFLLHLMDRILDFGNAWGHDEFRTRFGMPGLCMVQTSFDVYACLQLNADRRACGDDGRQL